jgi:hypothetical protein
MNNTTERMMSMECCVLPNRWGVHRQSITGQGIFKVLAGRCFKDRGVSYAYHGAEIVAGDEELVLFRHHHDP